MKRSLEVGEVHGGANIPGLVACRCVGCGRAWLGEPGQVCAACFEGVLEAEPHRMVGEVKRAVPFAVDRLAAEAALEMWIARAPLPVWGLRDVTARLTQHWVPLWMVDARVTARWEAELGFDDLRWEKRAGTIDRWVDNLPIPALEDWAEWEALLAPTGKGAKRLSAVHPALLPTQLPRAAWPVAEAALQERVGEDVRRACRAQQLRELSLDARWEEFSWTWVLVPVWSTWYADEGGRVHVLRVDGVHGRASGVVRASQKRARRRSAMWAASGLLCLVMAVFVGLPGIVLWPLLALTVLGTVVGFAAMAMAITPLLRVRGWNAARWLVVGGVRAGRGLDTDGVHRGGDPRSQRIAFGSGGFAGPMGKGDDCSSS